MSRKHFNPEYVKQFYMRHLSENGTVSGEEYRTLCPGHKETNPSFSVNLMSGVYNCFHPSCKLHGGGNMATFLAFVEDIPEAEAFQTICKEHDTLFPEAVLSSKKTKTAPKFPYTQEDITNRTKALLANPERLKFLVEECRWTEETIKKYEIGYNEDDGAYWIPIKENVEFVNIRKYAPNRKTKWFQLTGFSQPRLFPFENLQQNPIFIMEGEKDCILANQLGINAVTVTGGAGTFKNEWKVLFANKDVIICYDIDEAGRVGAEKVANMLAHSAKTVKVVKLDITEPPNGDFTDYIRAGKKIQDFYALVDKTEVTAAPSDAEVDIPDEIYDAALDQIDAKVLFYRRCKTNVRVIGADSSPFVIPREMQVACNRGNGRYCNTCRVGDKGCKASVIISETTPRVLDLVECTTKERAAIVREIFGIPPCKEFKIREISHQSLNRVAAIPSIDEISYDEETQNQSYAERELYYLGERLDTNNDYEVEMIGVPSPKDQTLVMIGYKVQPADSSIEEFKMSPELFKSLGEFQCQSNTSSSES